MNRTLWRTVVTGPEDPKLALFPSAFASTGESGASGVGVVRLVFDSMPPKSAAAAVSAHIGSLFRRGRDGGPVRAGAGGGRGRGGRMRRPAKVPNVPDHDAA